MITFACLLNLIFLSRSSSLAQNYLAARGTEQVLLTNGSTLFTMQNGINYPVIGVSGSDFLIQTDAGAAVFKQADRFSVLQLGPGGHTGQDVLENKYDEQPLKEADRLRVLPGGRFSTAEIAVSNVEATRSGNGNSWLGTITSSTTIGQVYGAFQWYVDGKPVKTEVIPIGVLQANKPYVVDFLIYVFSDGGNYSVHFWSGNGELRQTTDR